MVKPILLYGSEIWGFSKNIQYLEKVQLRFCKLLLKLKTSTPSYMIWLVTSLEKNITLVLSVFAFNLQVLQYIPNLFKIFCKSSWGFCRLRKGF
jgi:hypothetical protein